MLVDLDRPCLTDLRSILSVKLNIKVEKRPKSRDERVKGKDFKPD